jgi:hypothetical protein
MTLKELQQMIKEELAAYKIMDEQTEDEYYYGREEGKDSGVREAEDEVDVSVSDADVDAELGDEEEAAGEEDVLRAIYDLLAAHFGVEDETGDEEMPMDDVEGEEAPEADIEENATTDAKYQKTGFAPGGKKSEGPNVGYGSVGGKGGTGFDAGSKALQERFQKLANIIK